VDLALDRVNVGFRVRPAGMVDIAGDVLPYRAVDGPAVGQLEQILVLDRILVLLFAIKQRPEITDDPGPLLDRLGGEETEPGAGAANAIRLVRRDGRHDQLKTLVLAGYGEAALLERFRTVVRCFPHGG